MNFKSLVSGAALALFAAAPALAQQPVKIGMVTTLSGRAAILALMCATRSTSPSRWKAAGWAACPCNCSSRTMR